MISYAIDKHTVSFPTKIAASAGSPHIYNILLGDADVDNGAFVGKGDWVELDLYEEAEAPTFAGVIRGKSARGYWYVEVTADTDALFVHMPVIIAEDYSKKFTAEENFFNARNTVVKAYSLIKGDIIELSDEGFTGTPAAGSTVSVANKKLVVG